MSPCTRIVKEEHLETDVISSTIFDICLRHSASLRATNAFSFLT